MTILLVAGSRPPDPWRNAFETILASEGLAVWPDVGERAGIDCAVVAQPRPGALLGLPNLVLVSSVGMGVDHVLRDPDLPRGVAVARVVTPDMVDQVAEYATLAVLRVERDSDRFDALQRAGRWERRLGARPGGRRRVGILGLGAIGAEIARRLLFLGFPVSAWSRSGRAMPDVAVSADLGAVLARSDVLVCALPLTPDTRDLLGRGLFAKLPRGAHVVNVGRGEHLVEEDLLEALGSGQVAGATLDVFRREPLPPGHPFWAHPAVRVTPHSAGLSSPEASATRILENLARVRAGQPPLDGVDRMRGY